MAGGDSWVVIHCGRSDGGDGRGILVVAWCVVCVFGCVCWFVGLCGWVGVGVGGGGGGGGGGWSLHSRNLCVSALQCVAV